MTVFFGARIYSSPKELRKIITATLVHEPAATLRLEIANTARPDAAARRRNNIGDSAVAPVGYRIIRTMSAATIANDTHDARRNSGDSAEIFPAANAPAARQK